MISIKKIIGCFIIIALISFVVSVYFKSENFLAKKDVVPQKIINLHELKVKVIEIDLKSADLFLSHKKKIFEKAKLAVTKGTLSEVAYEDCFVAFKQAELDVEIAKTNLEEANLILELVKNGVENGKISLDDVRISGEIKKRR